jgi:hypothetical protein
MSLEDRELLKMVFMAERMPDIISDMKTALINENHDRGSEACYDYRCLMEMVTGVQVV